MLATRALKQVVVSVWGPRALSLGTVPVESMWWQHHLRNVNRASVWSSPAWRQYHAVTGWKKDVLAILRQCQDSTGGSRHTAWLQAVHELWYTLAGEKRELFDLPPGDLSPTCPGEDNVNVGFSDWLAS